MALATLAECKSQLDINPSNTAQDTRLTLYINAATQTIETYCGREFAVNAARTELHDGDSSNAVMTHHWPINSVSELWIDTSRQFIDTALQLAVTDYVIQGDNRITLINRISPKAPSSIKVIYSSGYAAIPADLTLACIWLVEWFYFHRNRQDMGRTNANKGDESIGILSEAPKMILQLIQPYKSFVSASNHSAIIHV